MNKGLRNKVALITGAGSGLGKSTAHAFAKEGTKVFISDINIAAGNATANEIRRYDGEVTFQACDVTNPVEVESLVSKTVEIYDGLDFAFNNAGIAGPRAKTHSYPQSGWDQVIKVNLTSVFLCMQYELRVMVEAGHGVIVNTSSVAGLVGLPTAVSYSAAKFGVVGLTKTAALEYAEQGIRVNAISPGWTRTGMIDHLIKTPDLEATIGSRHPMNRLGEPHEIAQAVIWLCSDSASFITGVVLPVDGGFVAK